MQLTQRQPQIRWYDSTRFLLRVARWGGIAFAAAIIALLWLVVTIHPPTNHVMILAISLFISGIVSITIGAGALWLVETAQLASIRLKFAIPAITTVAVIVVNVLMAAKFMFISAIDAQLLVVYLVFGAALALMLANAVSATIAHGIRRIALGAQRLASGRYGERLPAARLGGIRELTDLAHSFNQMTISIQDAFAKRDAAETNRRQVVAALSHDVRTPITSMRAMIEAIDDEVISDPLVIRRYHHSIRNELRHLSALVDNLFDLSQLEAGTMRLEMTTLNFEDLLSDVLAAGQEQAERAGVTLTGHIDGELPCIMGDPRHLYRVLTNVVHNAMRFTPVNGTILLHATAQKSVITVYVIDTGSGIAEHDLPNVFSLSYRGDRARTRVAVEGGSSGTGLGLTIARSIIEAHGGMITAQSPLSAAARQILRDFSTSIPPLTPGTAIVFTLPAAV